MNPTVRMWSRGGARMQFGCCLFAFIVLALAQSGCAARHDPEGPPLQLHRGAWGPRFSHNGPALQPVYDWTKLDTAFVSVLARDSGALMEARRSTPFRTGALLSLVGMNVFAIKSVITAVSVDEDNITRDDVDSVNSDLVFVIGFGVASIVFDQLALRHLRRGVSNFNVSQANGSGSSAAPGWLTQSVQNLSVTPAIQSGEGLRLFWRSSFNLR